MSSDFRRADLPRVLDRARANAAEAAAFGALSARQINWRPEAREWSIAQCFDHLILSHEPFIPIIEAARRGGRRIRWWERVPILPGFFGRILIETLDPRAGRKPRARPAFLPSASAIDPDVVTRFLDQHERLVRLMAAPGPPVLDGIVVTSPVMRLITYSLMDAYRIIVVHEWNHLDQARRVREWRGFPR